MFAPTGAPHPSGSLRPQDIFEECVAREMELERTYPDRVEQVLDELAFPPVFVRDLGLDNQENTLRHSSAAARSSLKNLDKIEHAIWEGGKYRDLLNLLHGAQDNDTRLYILARWLKHENICQPREFLRPGVYKKVIGTTRRQQLPGDVSIPDFHYGKLVRIWLPYFERLLQDKRHYRNEPNLEERLIKEGYDRRAVKMTLEERTRSAVSAVCSWLVHKRKANNVETIKNAYSRYQTALRLHHKQHA